MIVPSMDMELQAKVGSIVVHAEEATSAHGHAFDLEVLRTMIQDPVVQNWLARLRELALIPVKRAES